MEPRYRIGEIAARTGCSPESIRHYEKRGLLAAPARGEQGYRVYGQAALERINFIRHARHLGLDLATIQELLALSDQPNADCAAVDEIASRHLAHLEERIAALSALADELRLVTTQCRGGKTADCRIIQALFEH
ncbi:MULTISPECIES: helix-turn-helix domain-containing protein [unclassified Halomonas]|uniref:MerR family transcriptional regulator n=1 Tax=unclassified Halomonas TaxID=2609666 RepID=UPI00209ECC74|nr:MULTISPECIES: helix-turn-helix domain-containing protein [unclassified Halomonas]MCP1315556.1 helix-turn-helix domain-containing protein [Halomonas sp. 707D7]MCP1328452.1 helix-turn-helix domain-containing protein [Halomonas sp. 707D4]